VSGTALSDVLLDCLRPAAEGLASRLRALDPERWRRLVRLATRQKVAPLLYQRIRTLGLQPDVPPASMSALTTAYLRSAGRNVQHDRVFARLCTSLQARGVPVVALKGAFLAHTVYDHIALRPMGDLDLLVPAAALRDVPAILASTGYAPIASDDLERSLAFHAHLPRRIVADGSVAVEIHGTIAHPGLPGAIDMGELWARAVPVTIAGTDVMALAPEDLLLHLCGHIAYNHAFSFGLQPYCDIAATIRHYEAVLSWPAVVERAVRWRWDRGVFLSLLLARDWIGANVPDAALSALRPVGFDPRFCATVRAHVFSGVRAGSAELLTPAVARLWTGRDWRTRLRLLRERVFLDRDKLAAIYGRSRAPAGTVACYFERIAELLSAHRTALARLLRGDPRATRHATFLSALAVVLDAER
jgi:hypothetical protein